MTAQSGANSAGEEQAGAGEFHAWCARCHGVTGKGDGSIASSLEKNPIDLTTLAARNGGTFPTERIRQLVDGREMPRAHGTPEMPVWGNWFAFNLTAGGLLKKDKAETEKLIQQKVGRLVDYLKSLQQP